MIVDSAIYVDGRRVEADSVRGLRTACREKRGFAWVGLYEPTEGEFRAVTGEFGLRELAVRDARKRHLRPKIERLHEAMFVVLKAATYVEETETVRFGDVYLFVGDDFIVSVRYGEASELRDVRRLLEETPDLLERGPMAVLHAIVDRIVDDYEPVVAGLENDIDEIEEEVFGGEGGASRRIYELSREVIQFHRAVKPLAVALDRLAEDDAHRHMDHEAQTYLRDLRDRVLRDAEQVEGFRDLLSNILSVNLTMVGLQQNDQVQKISAWAAILIVPTIITGVYGMNFEFMPELRSPLGYPFALLLMAAACTVLYLGFRRSGWL
jgi:magnesium transporter